MPTTLQKIRQMIIKNDSSILDLKFGCEVTMGTKQIFFVVGMMPNGDPITVKKEGAYDSTKQGADVEKIDGKIKIIGRTITLSDVLRATDEIQLKKLYKENIIPIPKKSIYGDICLLWNLSDNDINHQSKKCQALILKILI